MKIITKLLLLLLLLFITFGHEFNNLKKRFDFYYFVKCPTQPNLSSDRGRWENSTSFDLYFSFEALPDAAKMAIDAVEIVPVDYYLR